jgi:hypothetical protein
MSDFEQFGVLLALKRDGSYMSVRDKGAAFHHLSLRHAPRPEGAAVLQQVRVAAPTAGRGLIEHRCQC